MVSLGLNELKHLSGIGLDFVTWPATCYERAWHLQCICLKHDHKLASMPVEKNLWRVWVNDNNMNTLITLTQPQQTKLCVWFIWYTIKCLIMCFKTGLLCLSKWLPLRCFAFTFNHSCWLKKLFIYCCVQNRIYYRINLGLTKLTLQSWVVF